MTERLRPQFPKARGRPRLDDRTVLSGITHMKRNGLRWRDAPPVYGSHKTLQPVCSLVAAGRLRPDLSHDGVARTWRRTARRQASQSGARPRAISRIKGGLNSKLHMVSDGQGGPLTFLLFLGQMSDARGVSVLLADLPVAKRILGDTGYDADWLREEREGRGLRICIPARQGRRRPASHNKRLHEKRCRVENAFSRLEDWRGSAARYTRYGDLFPAAICPATTVLCWLPKRVLTLG